jgi:hypothetical protein
VLFLSLAPICRWLILRDWRPVLWTRFTGKKGASASQGLAGVVTSACSP